MQLWNGDGDAPATFAPQIFPASWHNWERLPLNTSGWSADEHPADANCSCMTLKVFQAIPLKNPGLSTVSAAVTAAGGNDVPGAQAEKRTVVDIDVETVARDVLGKGTASMQEARSRSL